MELQEARDLYKDQNGRFPSSKMKLESIIAKLASIPATEETIEVVELQWGVTTIENLVKKQVVPEREPVKKMTTRRYNSLKAQWLI